VKLQERLYSLRRRVYKLDLEKEIILTIIADQLWKKSQTTKHGICEMLKENKTI